MTSRAQIVASIGPASASPEVLRSMIEHQLDVARLNFSWGDLETRTEQIKTIRQIANECGRSIPILADLPGPRIQEGANHQHDAGTTSAITSADEEFIRLAVEQNIDYIGVSYVGDRTDIEKCRSLIVALGGEQKIVAKIERAAAVAVLDEIIDAADAVMVARGDLGNEVPLEQIPFIQDQIIKTANRAGKPVIVATQMLLSMVDHPSPTRAEVSDVASAILQGADAVMLSDETTTGKYPIEAVAMMEKIILEAEKHLSGGTHYNQLTALSI